MAWLKRHLWLVTSVVLGVGILGFGGYLLWSGMSAETAAGEELNATREELKRLQDSKPFPNQQNLADAKAQLKKAQDFIADAVKLFPATPVPPGLNPQTFNSFAETTVTDLRKEMGRLGPTNYAFSFASVVAKSDFRPESLRPLAEQIAEVKMLCDILFASGISELRDVRRVRVSKDEPGGSSSEYLPSPMAVTRHDDVGMEVWPYDVKFTCFSAAFGQVLEALGKNEHALVVKHVRVEPDFVGHSPGVSMRGTNAPKSMVTLLQEQKMQVTLLIDVVKPVRDTPRGPGQFGPGGR